MERLKGADVVAALNAKLQKEIAAMKGYLPKLAIVRVGEKPDDIAYERGAVKRAATIGLECEVFQFQEEITNDEFVSEFQKINENKEIDGILLLRPLPKHIDEAAIERMISPEKDVDGISPMNLAKVFAGDESGYAPCTAEAVIEMLDFAGINLQGKRVTVVGRSMVVGKPFTMLAMKRNATVTVCHTKTADVAGTCRNAQILVAAAGKAKMLSAEQVGKDAVVIDVGINVDENGKLCGDVDFDSLEGIASMATPVPGGVGTVTTSVLAKHVVQAAKIKLGLY